MSDKGQVHRGQADPHLVRPPKPSVLLSERVVVFITDLVTLLEHDKAAVLVTRWCQIYEALHASKPRSFGIYARNNRREIY